MIELGGRLVEFGEGFQGKHGHATQPPSLIHSFAATSRNAAAGRQKSSALTIRPRHLPTST